MSKTAMNDHDSGNINDLKTDVAVIKNDVANVKATLVSMSGKIDGFAFVKQSDYDEDKKQWVTQAEFKVIKGLLLAIVSALIALAFEVIGKGAK